MFRKLIGESFGLAQKWHWDHIYSQYRATYEVDPAFVFNGYSISIYGPGRMVLGARSRVGQNGRLVCAPGGADLVIGEDCAIATNVRISANEQAPDRVTMECAPVHIGDRVRIGVNCYIGPGVTIGDDAVIGANSVVKNAVPAGAIVGGVPARLIRMK